jgi:hypothetical protein
MSYGDQLVAKRNCCYLVQNMLSELLHEIIT